MDLSLVQVNVLYYSIHYLEFLFLALDVLAVLFGIDDSLDLASKSVLEDICHYFFAQRPIAISHVDFVNQVIYKWVHGGCDWMEDGLRFQAFFRKKRHVLG